MVTAEPIAPGPEALAEVKAYLRKETADEDLLVERLIASAAGLCEAFTGQVLIRRGFTEILPRSGAWQRLGRAPVAAVTGVEEMTGDEGSLLPPDSYAIDIDAAGDGWVRVTASGGGRIRVGYQAGMAAEWSGLPEALRQGIVRLTAHLYTHRADDEGAGPPAAVAALWRPWRRMRLR